MAGITIDDPNNIEIKDTEGSSIAYSGTATTTVANVPSVAGNIISGASIFVGLLDLQVSFDNGTTYLTLTRRSFFSHLVKGNITQLKVKTPTGSSAYEIILNFEAPT